MNIIIYKQIIIILNIQTIIQGDFIVIKILYIHHAGGIGGAPRSLSFLINDLDKNIYEPIVLMVEDGPARKIFEEAGAKVLVDTRLGAFHGSTVSGMSFKLFLKNVLYALPSYVLAKKIIKKINPNIIHLNSSSLFMFAKAGKKVNNSIPIVSHIREPLLDSMFGSILRNGNHKYVDSYIAIEKYDLSTMNTTSKLTKVIYNSVDFEVYNPSVKSNVLREELNLNNDDTLILYLARISESNGVIELIQNIKENVNNTNIHFAIIGYNNQSINKYVKNVIDESSKNIHVMELRNDVPEVIASSDIMIVPFTQPHFSRSVIEAAAMGKPSIVSNVKGLDELVLDGVTGYIYDLNSSEDLVEKIDILASDENLRIKMGEKAHIRAMDLFDTKKNSKRVFELYEELL